MRFQTVGLAVFLSATIATSANAADIGIELNKLVSNDAGCQALMVVNHQGSDTLDSLVLELYTFDPSGIIGENLAVQLAPVQAQKMSVKALQLQSSCDQVASILLNSVPACTAAGADVEGCAGSIALSSKAEAQFTQ